MSRGISKLVNTFSSKSVNMLIMGSDELIESLNKTMKIRNQGIRAAAKEMGITHPTLSRVLAGEEPTLDFCLKAAKYLKQPPEVVLKMAGHLPPAPAQTEQTERLLYIFDQLSERDRENLLMIASALLEQEKRGS